ncbi:transposase [Desulfobacterales bacterium HSG17]|nr:transposase [Desulfobacterales bacterium HSG17]
MGKRRNRKYNNDFKLRAVKLCLETDKPNAEIARDLGVQQTTLSTWKQKYLKNQTQAFAGHNGSDTLSKEIKALKKELSIAKQERDILKKALAICNSQPEKYMP